MNVRKERRPMCGLTNLDYRTKGDLDKQEKFQANLKFTDFGTMGKTAFKRNGSVSNFKELSVREQKDKLAQTCGWKNTNGSKFFSPGYDDMNDYYKQRNKKGIKAPMLMATKREAQLEDNKWNEKVFTGDNAKLTAHLSGEARDRDYHYNADVKKRRMAQSVEQSHRTKEEIHAAADQETQLVRVSNQETLEGKIDLNKVKDIRRALRRRYASRKNFQKIFSQWDRKGQGQLDTDDIHHMMNQMGIKVNEDEAQVLLASADQNQNNFLSMNEFINLIFNANEVLDVDLKKLNPYQTKVIEGEEKKNFVNGLRQDAEHQQEVRQKGQWKFFMQKNLNNIALDLLENDTQKTYQVEPRDLMKVLERRVKLPEYLKQQPQHLSEYLNDFVDNQTGKIKYRDLVENLKTFDYDYETNTVRQPGAPQSHRSSSFHSDMFGGTKPKTIYDDEYIVLDAQKVPPNTLESITNRMLKVNRYFQRHFKSEDLIDPIIKQSMKADKNGNTSVEDIKNFVLTTLKDDIMAKRLSKRDIEGFLSSFIYNTYGETDREKIVNHIFTRDNIGDSKLNHRVRGNPPPVDTMGEFDLYDIKDEDIHNKRIQEVLTQIEDKVFDGPTKMHQVFKKFDKDGDGYVSYIDFEETVKGLQVQASNKEIASIIRLLDKDSKGFLDFKSFSVVVNPHMSEQVSIHKNEIHLPNLIPNRTKLNEYGEKGLGVTEKVRDVKKQFQPDSEIQLKAPTRFSSKPPATNTFLNFQPGPKTPGYLSDNAKFHFKRDLNVKVDFQAEDKQKKNKIQESKLREKQSNNDWFAHRITSDEIKKESLAQQKITHKAGVKQLYEVACHAQNL